MASFCGKCGAQLQEGSGFCVACGTPVVAAAPPVEAAPSYPPAAPSYPPAAAAYPPPPPPPGSYAPPPAAAGYPPPQYPPQGYAGYPPPPMPMAAAPSKGGGSKVLLIVLGVLGLGVLLVVGGVWYAVHRVSQKIHETAAQMGVDSNDTPVSGKAVGDVCQLLSKEDVSKAIGTEIVETKSDFGACHYMAVGSPSSFSIKHAGAITKDAGAMTGADAQQTEQAQKMMGQMMSGLGGGGDKAGDASERTSVLDVRMTPSGGKMQLKLQNAIFGKMLSDKMGAPAHPDIGDEALVIAGSLLLVRKGDAFFQFTYTQCPCGADEVKPLAKKVVDAY